MTNRRARACWVAGDWDALYPVIVAHLRRALAPYTRRDADLLDDLVTEAIARAWRAGIVPDDPFTYLATIGRNVARDHWKQHFVARVDRGATARAQLAQREDPAAIPSVSAERESARAVFRVALERALGFVPKRARDMLLLNVVHGVPCAAIAARVGISEGAVVQRNLKTRRALSARLTDMIDLYQREAA